LNLRHLSFLVAIQETGSFRRAAERVHVTQPSLSAAIAQLEREFDVPLVLRDKRRSRGLTPEGEEVARWSRRMLADRDALRQSLAEMRDTLEGSVQLAVIPTAEAAVPGLVRELARRHPKLHIAVVLMTATQIEEAVGSQSVDAGLTYVNGLDAAVFQSIPLFEETFVVAGPAARIGARASWSWRDAAKLPLCLLTPNMRHRHLVDAAFRKAGVVPNVVVEMNSLFGILAHMVEGEFCAVLPASSLPTALQGLVLTVRPMQGRAAGHPVGVIVPRRDPLPLRSAAMMAAAAAIGAQ
jgi:DNA-binding transcriptional LysR family regulator